MVVLGALVLAVLAQFLIALSLIKHHRQVFTAALTPGRALAFRFTGLVVLGLGAWFATVDVDPAIGLVVWLFGYLPLGGLIVVGGFSLLPPQRELRPRLAKDG